MKIESIFTAFLAVAMFCAVGFSPGSILAQSNESYDEVSHAITSIYVDMKSGVISILGLKVDEKQLKGLVVTLGELGELPISNIYSDGEIVVEFPKKGIPDGDYLLTVAIIEKKGKHREDDDDRDKDKNSKKLKSEVLAYYHLTVGAVGAEGPQGPKGEKGETGDTGPIGPQGVAGADGVTGPEGLQGIKGDKGDKGDAGETGPAGPAGPQGIAGADGAIGLEGPQGTKGDKGDKGDTGNTGTAGLQGPQGVPGPIGPAGPQGPQGVAGADGLPGEAGICPFSIDDWNTLVEKVQLLEGIVIPAPQPPSTQVTNNSGSSLASVNIGGIDFIENLADAGCLGCSTGFKEVPVGSNPVTLQLTGSLEVISLGTLGSFDNDMNYAVNITNTGGYCAELWIRTDTDIYFNDDTTKELIATVCAPMEVITFEKTFGGSGYDGGTSILQTADGGYVVAGYSDSSANVPHDAFLIRTDAKGDLLWEKTYGGTGSEVFHSLGTTSTGGYIMSGSTDSSGSAKMYLINTDVDGDVIWEKSFGGSGSDYGSSAQQTSDGGFIVVGYTTSFGAGGWDIYLVKTRPDGTSEWEKTFGGADDDFGRAVFEDDDGDYVVACETETNVPGASAVYLIKVGSDGSLIWEKTLAGGMANNVSEINKTADGGFVIIGLRMDNYDVNANLIKIDELGNLEWEKTYGGTGVDGGFSVQQTTDNGYIIAGVHEDSSYDRNMYLIRTDPSGNFLWEKSYGGAADDQGRAVKQTADEGFVVVGNTSSFGAGAFDVYLVKTDAEGNVH